METIKVKDSYVNIPGTNLSNKEGNITWSFRGIYPRITLYPNIDGTGQKFDINNCIVATFSIDRIISFLGLFEKLLLSKESSSYSVDTINIKFEDGVRTDKKYVQAHLTVGKDDAGIYYISIKQESKPEYIFKFEGSEYIRYYKNKNVIEDKQIISHLHAGSYYKICKAGVDNVLNLLQVEQSRNPIDKK